MDLEYFFYVSISANSETFFRHGRMGLFCIIFLKGIVPDWWKKKKKTLDEKEHQLLYDLAIQLGISQLEIKLDAKVIVENRRCSKIQTVLIEVLLLYCVIAGVSWPGSGRFGWGMCFERRINAPTFWLRGVVPCWRILLCLIPLHLMTKYITWSW